MHVLSGTLILAALLLFIRFTKTNDRRHYLWQWLPFVVGFGVMEAMIVYPAIVLCYAALFSRKHWRWTIPMFAVSAMFFAFHSWYAPKQASGPYSMHFDASIVSTFATYWQWALVPQKLVEVKPSMAAVAAAAPWILTAALALAAAWAFRRGNRVPLFFFLCFGILIAPVLPLRDHQTEYYLTLPLMAFAAMFASAVDVVWQKGIAWRAAAVTCALLYLACQWPVARFSAKWWYLRSERIQNVVHSVAEIRRANPGTTILLADVDEWIFAGAVVDRAFEAVRVHDVYIDSASAGRLRPDAFPSPPFSFSLDPLRLSAIIQRRSLLVYSVEGPQLRDITKEWTAIFSGSGRHQWPVRIEPGRRESSAALGPTWFPAEESFRWMPRQATVRLGVPESGANRLIIRGFFPVDQARSGPVRLSAAIGGRQLGVSVISRAEAPYEAVFELPEGLVQADGFEVSLEVNRTFQAPPDPRELGLVVDLIEVR
jgi:hypothetical protein